MTSYSYLLFVPFHHYHELNFKITCMSSETCLNLHALVCLPPEHCNTLYIIGCGPVQSYTSPCNAYCYSYQWCIVCMLFCQLNLIGNQSQGKLLPMYLTKVVPTSLLHSCSTCFPLQPLTLQMVTTTRYCHALGNKLCAMTSYYE